MPRRYRPPTRRRKSKKHLPEEPPAASYEPAAAPAPAPSRVAVPVAVAEERSAQLKHIGRDYSYVLAELRLIALIVAFITFGLVLTAIFR